MGKMSELSAELDELKTCGEKITTAADTLAELITDLKRTGEIIVSITESLTALFSEADPVPQKKKAARSAKKTEDKPSSEEPHTPSYTKEDVRALLARTASEDGGKHRMEVREIVRKYGNGGCLTDVDEKDYPALVAEVEGLKDA